MVMVKEFFGREKREEACETERETTSGSCTRFTVIQQTVCLTTLFQCILQPPFNTHTLIQSYRQSKREREPSLLFPSQLVGSSVARSFHIPFPFFLLVSLSLSIHHRHHPAALLLTLLLAFYGKCNVMYVCTWNSNYCFTTYFSTALLSFPVCAMGFASAYIRMAPVYRKKYPMKSRIHSSYATTITTTAVFYYYNGFFLVHYYSQTERQREHTASLLLPYSPHTRPPIIHSILHTYVYLSFLCVIICTRNNNSRIYMDGWHIT